MLQSIPYQSNEKAFYIRKIRANFNAKSIDEHPHRHEFTELLYIKDGSGKHEIDGKEYSILPNTLYVISKGQVHQFLYAKDIEGILLRFQDSILPNVQSSEEGFYYNLLFGLRHHNAANLKESDIDFVESLLNRILDEYKEQTSLISRSHVLDLSLIQHLLYPIIILLNRDAQAGVDQRDYEYDRFTEFSNHLELSFKKNHDVAFYASLMGLPSRKLTKICIRKTGKSGKKIIHDRIQTEAKRLLKYTSLPLKEIADQLGYKDLGYFCRAFKKAQNMTPTEYKTS